MDGDGEIDQAAGVGVRVEQLERCRVLLRARPPSRPRPIVERRGAAARSSTIRVEVGLDVELEHERTTRRREA